MYVCMTYVCTHVCAHVHVCACTCGGQKLTLDILSSHFPFPSYFESGSVTEPRAHTLSQTGCPPSSSGPPISVPEVLSLRTCITTFTWVAGSELRSSFLHGKPFSDWVQVDSMDSVDRVYNPSQEVAWGLCTTNWSLGVCIMKNQHHCIPWSHPLLQRTAQVLLKAIAVNDLLNS